MQEILSKHSLEWPDEEEELTKTGGFIGKLTEEQAKDLFEYFQTYLKSK